MATPIRAGIFDVDGVLVDSPHERAWREAVARYADPALFTTEFYQANVAGRTRQEGALVALERLGVADAAARAPEYAEAKQALIEKLIEAGAFRSFPDAMRLATAMHAAGMKLALASASRNAKPMLSRLTLADGQPVLPLFDADLSGQPVPRGKPDPAIFLAAATALGIPPEACVVVEDAPAGVRAALAGGMAAIGIARLHDDDLLRAVHANLVVNSLDRVDVPALLRGEVRALPENPHA